MDAPATEPTAQERQAASRFKPGNPGRPKGARNKLAEDFIKAMQSDFAAHGMSAVAEVRETKPDQYLKVIASILPKEIDLGEDAAALVVNILRLADADD